MCEFSWKSLKRAFERIFCLKRFYFCLCSHSASLKWNMVVLWRKIVFTAKNKKKCLWSCVKKSFKTVWACKKSLLKKVHRFFFIGVNKKDDETQEENVWWIFYVFLFYFPFILIFKKNVWGNGYKNQFPTQPQILFHFISNQEEIIKKHGWFGCFGTCRL